MYAIRSYYVSDLSFESFALLMLPIHLAIGLVEGLVTAVVVRFVGEVRPDVLAPARQEAPKPLSLRRKLVTLGVAAVLTGA